MCKHIQSKFKVKRIENEDVWLKELETGLVAAVEQTHDTYSDKLQTKIQCLIVGEIIEVKLESQNVLHTIWTFAEIEK